MSDEELAQWVIATCRLWGASVETSYQVAGLFVKAVNDAADRDAAQSGGKPE